MTFTKKSPVKLGLAGMATALALFLPKLVQAESYTVKSGDTLSSIAKSHNQTVDEISKLNQISNIHLIQVGQVLELAQPGAANNQVKSQSTETSQPQSNTLSSEDAAAKEWIAQKESGGSYTAQNGQYYGRYQLTISYLNGDLSAENQERVADSYVAGRYGSWSAAKSFWLAKGWY
ncbi:aggregation-promoting factor [Streptococcus oricebi]